MNFHAFRTSQSGAVTVDWVVLTAALVGLGLATMGVVSSGVQNASSDVDDTLRANLISTSFTGQLADAFFDTVSGAELRGWGYDYPGTSYGGWTDETDNGVFQLIKPGYAGITGMEPGSHALDMLGAGNDPLSISQTVGDLRHGQSQTLTITAADVDGHAAVDIYFGGELIGTADPNSRAMEDFTFDIVGGSGDGTDKLTITETRTEPGYFGTIIDSVVIE